MAKHTTIKKKKVSLSFDGEAGKTVFVAGDFNDWSIEDSSKNKKLRKLKEDNDQSGHYTINMFLPLGKHEYKFFCEDQWYMDPLAEDKQPNIFGTYNSVLEVN